MEKVERPRSSYYHWKKTKPIEYKLIKKALIMEKVDEAIIKILKKN